MRIHKSDCAVHNEPALPKGECDCGAVEVEVDNPEDYCHCSSCMGNSRELDRVDLKQNEPVS